MPLQRLAVGQQQRDGGLLLAEIDTDG